MFPSLLRVGVIVRMINATGVNSIKGTVVELDTSVGNAVEIADATSDHAIGIMYSAGKVDGDEVWVVVHGIAEVLLKNSTSATKGYWVKVSSDAGRADATVTSPPGADPTHWDEIGHCMETKSSGTNVLCKIMLHFN